jgi:hypothetical protein
MYSYISILVGKEYCNEFGIWAFGENYEDCTPLQLAHRWNLHHRALYEVDRKDEWKEDIRKMTELWKTKKCKNIP